MTNAVIVSTARTPLAKSWKGAFNMTHGATLGGHAVAAAVQRAGIEAAEVDDVIMGCANPEGATGANIARQIALRDGRDDEYVVCALLHDIGDTLGTLNHFDIAAAIVKPFVDEANRWMVQHHGIFQGYYFFHHLGLDRNLREQFRGHQHFARTEEFCALYDNPAFDPQAETLPIGEFEPMLRRVFTQPKQSIYKAAVAA